MLRDGVDVVDVEREDVDEEEARVVVDEEVARVDVLVEAARVGVVDVVVVLVVAEPLVRTLLVTVVCGCAVVVLRVGVDFVDDEVAVLRVAEEDEDELVAAVLRVADALRLVVVVVTEAACCARTVLALAREEPVRLTKSCSGCCAP